jgi:hypothetical protein
MEVTHSDSEHTGESGDGSSTTDQVRPLLQRYNTHVVTIDLAFVLQYESDIAGLESVGSSQERSGESECDSDVGIVFL